MGLDKLMAENEVIRFEGKILVVDVQTMNITGTPGKQTAQFQIHSRALDNPRILEVSYNQGLVRIMPDIEPEVMIGVRDLTENRDSRLVEVNYLAKVNEYEIYRPAGTFREDIPAPSYLPKSLR